MLEATSSLLNSPNSKDTAGLLTNSLVTSALNTIINSATCNTNINNNNNSTTGAVNSSSLTLPTIAAAVGGGGGKKEKSLTMDFLGFRNVNKVLIGDLLILIASLLFGFGFIGQRAVAVDGLGPMTCNAFRFTVSAIMIFVFLPIIETNTKNSNSSNPDSTIDMNLFLRLFKRLYIGFKDCLSSIQRLNRNNTSTSTTAVTTAITSTTTPETVYTNESLLTTPLLTERPSTPSPLPLSKDSVLPATPVISLLLGQDDIIEEGAGLGVSSNDFDIESSLFPSNGNSTNPTNPTNHKEDDNTTNKYYRDLKQLKRNIIFWGVVLGLINFLGSGFQQFGIFYTTANKVAFISGFDLFFTPVLTYFIPTLKNNSKPSLNIWIAVGLSIFGLYLLSDMSIMELSMGHGEFFAMISALFWSLHIIYTDMATSYIDSIYMIAIQSLLVGMLSLILALATESMPWLWVHFFLVIPWLLVLSMIEALGLVFMIKGQKYSPPTHAAIITSLEGVFASVGTYLFLGETLSIREGFGCVLMLTAAIITEIKITFNAPNPKKVDDESQVNHHHLHHELAQLQSISEEHTHRH